MGHHDGTVIVTLILLGRGVGFKSFVGESEVGNSDDGDEVGDKGRQQ